jgi:putative membrane protein
MSSITATRWLRRVAIAAVVLVPLAFAGLFVGALGQGDKSLDNIPIAIVNQDTLQQVTQPDGTVQNVFAGRQLVTELTGSKGFDWTITNEVDAAAALKAGTVYAILTVPSDFSTSILSLSSSSPKKADISIRTDDAHSYLTGSVAQVVGQTMADTFGNAITAQYISGIYASVGSLGSALSTAADGASQLSGARAIRRWRRLARLGPVPTQLRRSRALAAQRGGFRLHGQRLPALRAHVVDRPE